MEKIDQRNTQFFIQTRNYNLVTIYVVACHERETERDDNGPTRLSERGKKLIRKNIEKNLNGLIPDLRPNILACGKSFHTMEALIEFTGMLSAGNNGKGILTRKGFNLPVTYGSGPSKTLWQGAKQCAEIKWVLRWRKKILASHWLDAGGEEEINLKQEAERAVLRLVHEIAKGQESDMQAVGIIAADSFIFDLQRELNDNRFGPLRHGDIIKYVFEVEGEHAEKIVMVEQEIFLA